MKINITDTQPHNFDSLLFSMAKVDAEINLSQNPLLPDLISTAMLWPVVKLLFMAGDESVAWFAALNTGKAWFSLPHFNNGAFWFDEIGLNRWLQLHQIQLQVNNHLFFNTFVNNPDFYNISETKNRLFVINLEPEDFSAFIQPDISNLKLRLRSYLPLSANRLEHKTDSILQIKNSTDKQMNSFTGSIRHKINKARRNGIVIRIGGVELLDDFYSVYRQNIHQLGSFGLLPEFFRALFQNYSNGQAHIVIADYEGKPVGSAILLTFLHFAENPWFATLRTHNHLYVSYLLHWEMMKLAIGAECDRYSFGYSTKGSGVHHYKKQWGAVDRTIYLNSNQPIFDHLGKMQYLRRLIRHLPLSFTKLMDRFIATKYY